MKEIKGVIKIEITRNREQQNEDIEIDGAIGLCMYGLAKAIAQIERSLPEEQRAEFRADFLATINDARREEI